MGPNVVRGKDKFSTSGGFARMKTPTRKVHGKGHHGGGEPAPVNLVMNGDFETDLTVQPFWSEIYGESIETMTRDTVSPLSGLASLHVVTPGLDVDEGVQYAPTPRITLVPEATYRLSFLVRGSGGPIEAFMDWPGATTAVWSDDLPATKTAVSVDVVIPAGVTDMGTIFFWTPLDGPAAAVEFWLDNVSLTAVP